MTDKILCEYKDSQTMIAEAQLTHSTDSILGKIQFRLLTGRTITPLYCPYDDELLSTSIHRRLSELREEGMDILWYDAPNRKHKGYHREHYMIQKGIDNWNDKHK